MNKETYEYNTQLCRAKKTDTNEWVYGYYMSLVIEGVKKSFIAVQSEPDTPDAVRAIIFTSILYNIKFYEIKLETLCRCFLEKETPEKSIYEHDIFVDDDTNYLFEIVFDGTSWIANNDDENFHMDEFSVNEFSGVIGNTIDNKIEDFYSPF